MNSRFFLDFARFLQNKNKLATVPHSIDISMKYDRFNGFNTSFGTKYESNYRYVCEISITLAKYDIIALFMILHANYANLC